jgi:hypothetical protein
MQHLWAVSSEQVQYSEYQDNTAKIQAMLHSLLLLSLLPTVPQNILFPLTSLGLAQEAHVPANNGQISREC